MFELYPISNLKSLRSIGNILNNKSQTTNSFVEIGNVRKKLETITQIFIQQKETCPTIFNRKQLIRKEKLYLCFDADRLPCL